MRDTNTEPHTESYPSFPRGARVRIQLNPWLEEMEEYCTKNRCAAAFFSENLSRAPVFADLRRERPQAKHGMRRRGR